MPMHELTVKEEIFYWESKYQRAIHKQNNGIAREKRDPRFSVLLNHGSVISLYHVDV